MSGSETVVTPWVLRQWPLPDVQSSKESRGRALVVGGNQANPGSVLLAAEATLRAGAGKVQVLTVETSARQLAVALPEMMVDGLPMDAAGDIAAASADRIIELADGCRSVLLGPGLFSAESAVALLDAVIPHLHDVTVVLDALGMAWVGARPAGLTHLDGRVVVSPNNTELGITLGEELEEDDIADAARRLASEIRAVVTSGGSQTWTASPEGALWRSDMGGPGLGTAGSGDVKAGVILGLCARGATPAQAAVWAGYLHGSAGARLASTVGPTGFLARELAAEVPRVLTQLGG